MTWATALYVLGIVFIVVAINDLKSAVLANTNDVQQTLDAIRESIEAIASDVASIASDVSSIESVHGVPDDAEEAT